MLNTDLIPVDDCASGVEVLANAILLKERQKRREQALAKRQEQAENAGQNGPRVLTKRERFERLALMSRDFIEKKRGPKLVFLPPPKPIEPIQPTLDFSAIPNEWKCPMLEEIARRVCSLHGVSIEELKSNRRFRAIADARFHFYYLARKHTSKSFPEIARHVNKDHTTVLHGCNEFERRRKIKREGFRNEK